MREVSRRFVELISIPTGRLSRSMNGQRFPVTGENQ